MPIIEGSLQGSIQFVGGTILMSPDDALLEMGLESDLELGLPDSDLFAAVLALG